MMDSPNAIAGVGGVKEVSDIGQKRVGGPNGTSVLCLHVVNNTLTSPSRQGRSRDFVAKRRRVGYLAWTPGDEWISAEGTVARPSGPEAEVGECRRDPGAGEFDCPIQPGAAALKKPEYPHSS